MYIAGSKIFLYNWKCLFQDVIILLKSIQRICICSRVTNIEYFTFKLLLFHRMDEWIFVIANIKGQYRNIRHDIFHYIRQNGWPNIWLIQIRNRQWFLLLGNLVYGVSLRVNATHEDHCKTIATKKFSGM